MAQHTACPSCRRDFQVPDALIGQAVRCPTCAATFQTNAADNGISLTPIAPPPAPRTKQVVEALPEVHAESRRPDRMPPYPRRDVEPHRGTLLLVLGIISFFICQVVLGPIVWVLASGDLKKIRAGQMDPAGESNTNAGRICGIVATIYGLFNLMVGAVILIVMFVLTPPAPFRPMPTAPVRPTAPFPAPVPPRPPFQNPPQFDEPLNQPVLDRSPCTETRPWPGR